MLEDIAHLNCKSFLVSMTSFIPKCFSAQGVSSIICAYGM